MKNVSATIKLFLLTGDPKRLRTAELSNWSGKAIAAPRTDIDSFLSREELSQSGVYFLLGIDPEDGQPMAYIGESEAVKERFKQQHNGLDFWNSAIAFVSKDENLTKSHIRYLEGRLIEISKQVARYKLHNAQLSGAKLPEADANDMEVFLERICQLLPVLGSDLLTPIVSQDSEHMKLSRYFCSVRDIHAEGGRTPNGFVIYEGSKATLKPRKSAAAWVLSLRQGLEENGSLRVNGTFYIFTKDVEFSSPSAAAAVIHGGNVAGPVAWKTIDGLTLKENESDS